MRVLLDTHTLLWWMSDDERLSPLGRSLIADLSNISFVSAASAWEIATKVRLGKLPAASDLVKNFVPDLTLKGIKVLAVTVEHGLRAGLLSGPHKDPFDRMLVAQAIEEDLPIVSNDRAFDLFNVPRLW